MKTFTYSAILIVCCTLIICGNSCTGQKDIIGVMFYNVENVFDTIDSPGIADSEFTPQSKKHWNTERYRTKLEHLALVIASRGAPSLVGLAEIENKQVLEDLIAVDALKTSGYAIVHFDSPDERGIDVALLYKTADITIRSADPIFVNLPQDDGGTTRDILFIKAHLNRLQQDLYIFINHWPSRAGGKQETQLQRIVAANTLKHAIDSLNNRLTNPAIVIMGDFNDTPSDASITDILNAKTQIDTNCGECLINLMANLQGAKYGSYFFDGNWQLLDQIIVSGILVGTSTPRVILNSVQVVKNNFQLYKNKKYGYLPSKTYSGYTYHGGYSDHLPVYMEIQLK